MFFVPLSSDRHRRIRFFIFVVIAFSVVFFIRHFPERRSMTMMMMTVPFSSNDGERDRFLLRHRDHRSRLSHLLYRYMCIYIRERERERALFFLRKVTLFSPFFLEILLKIGKSHTRFTHNNNNNNNNKQQTTR